MLDYQLDPDMENDNLGDAYLDWLDENFSLEQVQEGDCPSYEEWIENQANYQTDDEEEVS